MIIGRFSSHSALASGHIEVCAVHLNQLVDGMHALQHGQAQAVRQATRHVQAVQHGHHAVDPVIDWRETYAKK